jgi:hypothetical protein
MLHMSRSLRGLSFALALGGLFLAHGRIARADTVVTNSSGPSLVSSGLVTLGLGYGAAVIVAATSSHAGDNRLYVPILGPWLDLGDRGSCPVAAHACDHETTNKLLIVGDGIVQAVGAATILAGLLSPGHTSIASTKTFSIAQIVPVTFGQGRPGLAAYGSF